MTGQKRKKNYFVKSLTKFKKEEKEETEKRQQKKKDKIKKKKKGGLGNNNKMKFNRRRRRRLNREVDAALSLDTADGHNRSHALLRRYALLLPHLDKKRPA